MDILVILLKVALCVVALLLIGIVLLQQGKVSGLSGAIGGAGESYWGKNKARSMEGGLHKMTVVVAVLYILLSLILNVL